MKTLAQLIFVSAFASVVSLTMAAEAADHLSINVDSGDRPIGVEAKNWLPISEKLGFVIVKTIQPPPDKTARIARAPCVRSPSSLHQKPCNDNTLIAHIATPPDPAAGYFMIKSEDGWRRLEVMTPADIAVAMQSRP